jgi:hypothetical protein
MGWDEQRPCGRRHSISKPQVIGAWSTANTSTGGWMEAHPVRTFVLRTVRSFQIILSVCVGVGVKRSDLFTLRF